MITIKKKVIFFFVFLFILIGSFYIIKDIYSSPLVSNGELPIFKSRYVKNKENFGKTVFIENSVSLNETTGNTKDVALIYQVPLVSFDNNQKISENFDIPEEFRWRKIDYNILKEYLLSRNSELAEDGNLEMLNRISKKFNLDPLLFISIIGAEQSFVKKSSASKNIIKNPYNLYGSWEKYGESFEKSSEIVALTILNIMNDYKRSDYNDPYLYLNFKYAEDPNWHNNVSSIHNQLIKMQL